MNSIKQCHERTSEYCNRTLLQVRPVTVMQLADYRSMNKLKSLLQKTRKVTLFVWKSIRKNTPLSSEIHCYVKNRKGLHF